MKKQWFLVLACATLSGVPGGPATAADRLAAGVPAAEGQVLEETGAFETSVRQELVASILAMREKASGRTFSPRLRASLARKLESTTSERLQAFRDAGGLGDIDVLARVPQEPRSLGNPALDLVYTPVTPCRIVNTTVAGGIIGANTTRSLYVNGNTAGTFENQGGTTGGCGIPDTATAVMMNFVAVGPSGPGDFRAFPFSAAPTPPLASVINYSNLPGLNIANGLAQPVCNPATTTCTFDLIVQADVAASHLVVDVVGYFSAARTAVSVLRYQGTNSDNTISGTIEQLRVVGNFTKESASTAITTAWNAHVQTAGTVGVSFCHYQVRIDGNPPAGVGFAGLGSGVVNYGDHQAASTTDFWTGLAAGTHEVTIWVRGLATACGLNFGNFEHSVVVTEQ